MLYIGSYQLPQLPHKHQVFPIHSCAVAEEAGNFLYIQHCGPGTIGIPYSVFCAVSEEAGNFL